MKPATIEPYKLHILWRETNNRIEHYTKLVAEGMLVDEASQFARWLQFSGLLGVFKQYPQQSPLPVDGVSLAKKTDALVSACGEIYQRCGKSPEPEYKKSDIDQIKEQLAAITAKLA